jgi:hypothetical protein
VQQEGAEETQATHEQETQERNALPTPAQHAARATLQKEIATMTLNNLGANAADKRWTRLTKHVTEELDRKIETLTANHDREMEATEGRIAIPQVAMDKSECHVTNEEQKRKNKRPDDKEIKETIQRRITKNRRAAESTMKAATKSHEAQRNRNDFQQNEGTRPPERIEKLEDTVEEQKQETPRLKRTPTTKPQGRDDPRKHNNPRMATPNRMAAPNRERRDRRNREEEERGEAQTPERNNQWNAARSINNQPTKGQRTRTLSRKRQRQRQASLNEQGERRQRQKPGQQTDSTDRSNGSNRCNPTDRTNRRDQFKPTKRSNRFEPNRSNQFEPNNRRDSHNEPNNGCDSHNEMPKEEKQSMERSIKEFDKKRANISKLTDTPTLESIETACHQLANLAPHAAATPVVADCLLQTVGTDRARTKALSTCLCDVIKFCKRTCRTRVCTKACTQQKR